MVPENFSLHVPKGSGNPLVAALQMIPANHLDAWRMHRVGAGETLAGIAKRYGVTPANIVSVNRLESAQAVEGDRLLIPSVQRAPAPVAKKTISASARRRTTGPRQNHHRLRPPRPQEPGGRGAQHRQLSPVGQVVNLRPIGNRPAELARPNKQAFLSELSASARNLL